MDQKQMRELESRCIQEHAPFCTAACPIHVDARGMLAAVAQGDFAAGLQILRKTLPFPGIIAHICDQPCREPCKRWDAGGAIHVAAVERACVAYGGTLEPVKPLPPKPRRIAVVGGGLSGLTVAYDLARKGYEVVIYEATGRLGGQAWNYVPDRLPAEVLEKDLEVISQLKIEVLLNSPVGKIGHNGRQPPLSLLCDEYEVVYLGIGPESSETYDLAVDDRGRIQIDPQTRMTSREGVFSGGGMLRAESALLDALMPAITAYRRSPISSILDGRRAATSIDRHLQRVSLTAARGNEGPYETRLYTSSKGLQAVPEVHPADPAQGYSQAEAIQEAQRCIQCDCMECVKVCEYLASYGGYPKKYIREIYNNLSIVMGTRYANQMINSCSLCGLCAQVCPEDLDMGEICREARELMVKQKRMPPSAHDFALREMAFNRSPAFTLWRNQPGTKTSAYALFPGCQLSGSSPEYIEKLYPELIQRLPAGGDGGVGLILGCCGAPAVWAGRSDLFQERKVEFLSSYHEMGSPCLILACPSCYQVFKTHYPEVAIRSLWEVLVETGAASGAENGREELEPRRLVIHDPCSSRFETAIQDSVRELAQRQGYEIEELPLSREETECCSFGGHMWLANPDLSKRVIQRRISASETPYVTYCAMCRDFFARQGKPGLHILDLLYADDLPARARRKDPGFSKRQANRRRLKRSLLEDFWKEGERMEERKPYQSIQLIIPPEVQARLEERLILVEDIQQVIEFAERTNSKLLNKSSGHWLAQHKLDQVTYWVEYSPSGEAYLIHNAYCHRMVIGDEGKR